MALSLASLPVVETFASPAVVACSLELAQGKPFAVGTLFVAVTRAEERSEEVFGQLKAELDAQARLARIGHTISRAAGRAVVL